MLIGVVVVQNLGPLHISRFARKSFLLLVFAPIQITTDVQGCFENRNGLFKYWSYTVQRHTFIKLFCSTSAVRMTRKNFL